MNEKKRPVVNPTPIEPIPEFVQDVIQTYPRLRAFAMRVNRRWQQVAKALGLASPPQKRKAPTYYHVPQAAKPAVKPSISEVLANAPPRIDDELVADANALIQRYTQCSPDNAVEKANIATAIVVFEKKYYTADLKALSFDTLVLYEQVILIGLTLTT